MTSPLPLANRPLAARALKFWQAGVLQDHELLVVDAIQDRFPEQNPDVLLAFALAVRAPRLGHVGVILTKVADQVDIDRFRRTAEQEEPPALDWPADARTWQQAVLDARAVARLEPPYLDADDGRNRELPFVAQELPDGDWLLMTRRMWRAQETLANALFALSESAPLPAVPQDFVTAYIGPEEPDDEGAAAVRAAARGRLTVVTGGPGTGKTYSIKRLLAMLVTHTQNDSSPLRIELAAPTGKAAVRMAEAMGENLTRFSKDEDILKILRNLAPRTLHKLLGVRPDGTCRHGRHRPIEADVIVVDEVSMVDLMLMRRLVESVRDGARLILLGDRDQLASVEAGTVLADIVRGTEGPLGGAVVNITRSRRFEGDSVIGTIATALQQRAIDAPERVARILCGEESHPAGAHALRYLGAPHEGRPTKKQLDELASPYVTPVGSSCGYAALLAHALRAHGARHPALTAQAFHQRLLEQLDGYRVLAVHRRGPLGVAGLDRELSARVRHVLTDALTQRQDALQLASSEGVLPTRAGHWLGRPLLITENSYDIGLMNGDIGLVLPSLNGLVAVFPVLRAAAPTTLEVPLSRLPPHEGALAMTVHKSQGSQFHRVGLVLAAHHSPIQTRELLYTGITRARKAVVFLGARDILREALTKEVQRASGVSYLLNSRHPG